ncbi:Transmembrane protein 41B [Entomortierella chlamydospora]|uniref:Transmembrane protein 41B n=1 Tax=Entomortierella chlamydospora TaxID=101097 RepID=A0A9P6N1I2_9FUNG|nr:Transmembrane protein 41B [Entomortierella chlamydospora]
MSNPTPTDTTPLLRNGSSASNNNKNKSNGVRQHLLNMTPLQSFILLVCLATVVFSSVYILLEENLPRDLTDEQRKWLKFPRNAEDVQHLSVVLETYLAQHYYAVMTCFAATYLSMQAFAVPGSMMLSVLGGALFKFRIGLALVLFCASFDWFMNIASPHLDIPPLIFFFGTFVGVLPNSLVTVQAGATLAALASPDDFTLFTPQNIIMTIVIAICLLLPIVLHRHVDDPTATPKANSDEEDPLARGQVVSSLARKLPRRRITPKQNDTVAIAEFLHKYDAFAFFDYAGVGSYTKVDMNPRPSNEFVSMRDSKAYKDGVFLSPHKMAGGPGSSGVLVARLEVFS